MKAAVIYWSGTGNTEQMANAIAEGAGAELFSVSDFTGDIADYDRIAFGCSAMRAVQHHPRPGPRQSLRHRQPDPRSRPRHQSPLARQFSRFHHLRSSLLHPAAGPLPDRPGNTPGILAQRRPGRVSGAGRQAGSGGLMGL